MEGRATVGKTPQREHGKSLKECLLCKTDQSRSEYSSAGWRGRGWCKTCRKRYNKHCKANRTNESVSTPFPVRVAKKAAPRQSSPELARASAPLARVASDKKLKKETNAMLAARCSDKEAGGSSSEAGSSAARAPDECSKHQGTKAGMERGDKTIKAAIVGTGPRAALASRLWENVHDVLRELQTATEVCAGLPSAAMLEGAMDSDALRMDFTTAATASDEALRTWIGHFMEASKIAQIEQSSPSVAIAWCTLLMHVPKAAVPLNASWAERPKTLPMKRKMPCPLLPNRPPPASSTGEGGLSRGEEKEGGGGGKDEKMIPKRSLSGKGMKTAAGADFRSARAAEKGSTCKCCKRYFKCQTSLNIHVGMSKQCKYGLEKSYTCKCCKRQFQSTKSLHTHIGMSTECKSALWGSKE